MDIVVSVVSLVKSVLVEFISSENLAKGTKPLKWIRDHTTEDIINDPNDPVQTCSWEAIFTCFLFQVELATLAAALASRDWIVAMQEELLQFIRNNVCYLVDRLAHQEVIGVKWIFKNKKDAKNNARLVAKGYAQCEASTLMKHFLQLQDLKPSDCSSLMPHTTTSPYIKWTSKVPFSTVN